MKDKIDEVCQGVRSDLPGTYSTLLNEKKMKRQISLEPQMRACMRNMMNGIDGSTNESLGL